MTTNLAFAAMTDGIDRLPDAESRPDPAPGSSGDRLSFSVAQRNAFFARVVERTRQHVPVELVGFSARPAFNLVKLAYGNERVHYEVAVDNSRRLLEIALHFEDGPISTLAYLRWFDPQIVELKDLLGPEIELERWTVSWGRLYELWPLESLARPVADRVAARLGAYITTLQPRVDEAGIKPERSAQPSAGRFRPRRR